MCGNPASIDRIARIACLWGFLAVDIVAGKLRPTTSPARESIDRSSLGWKRRNCRAFAPARGVAVGAGGGFGTSDDMPMSSRPRVEPIARRVRHMKNRQWWDRNPNTRRVKGRNDPVTLWQSYCTKGLGQADSATPYESEAVISRHIRTSYVSPAAPSGA